MPKPSLASAAPRREPPQSQSAQSETPDSHPLSELQFSALVDELKVDAARVALLTDLLHEDNPIYDQRSTAATIRMRGWVLLAFEHLGLPEAALLYVLEELDNGRDVYLVAAAARVLRSYPSPTPAVAPFLMRAINNIQFHDDLVCLDNYGAFAISRTDAVATTAVTELLVTLRWLGARAHAVMPEMEALLAENKKGLGALSIEQMQELGDTLEFIRKAETTLPPVLQNSVLENCCATPTGLGNFREWAFGSRRGASPAEPVIFEDQDGGRIPFDEFFRGRPSVVAFFYTRCGNPLKCSLTVSKLARLQKLLLERGLDGRIRTAAITYDPAFDLPARLRGYGESRGVRMDGDHRLLRSVEGMAQLRAHFRLGVNFVSSLVNRHRVEVYILDSAGRIAVSYQQIQWDESDVAEKAASLLTPDPACETGVGSIQDSKGVSGANSDPLSKECSRSPLSITLPVVSLVTAFFPKCAVCWSTYLSIAGIAGLERLPYSPWLLPVFAGLMLINLTSLWFQKRSQQRLPAFYLAVSGTFVILVFGAGYDLQYAGLTGITLIATGSLLGVFAPGKINRRARVAPSSPRHPLGHRSQ